MNNNYMSENERLGKRLQLAWILGVLKENEPTLEDISKLNDRELQGKITDFGRCIDWD